MSVLIVYLCIRFGCRDPQVMVNSIRCVMQVKRRELLSANPTASSALLLGEYLLRLRAWHNSFVTEDDDTIRTLMKLDVAEGTPCLYMEYDTGDNAFIGLCSRGSEDGLPWCAEHAADVKRTNNVDEDVSHEITYIPISLRDHDILVAGQFEQRWKSSGWKCSHATIQDQVGELAHHPFHSGRRTLATFRFVGFGANWVDIKTILAFAETSCPWGKMDKLDVFIAELLFESETMNSRQFSELVVQHIPLLQFPASAVYVGNVQTPALLVLNMNAFAQEDGLKGDRFVKAREKYKECVVKNFGKANSYILQVQKLIHLRLIPRLYMVSRAEVGHMRYHVVFSSHHWTKAYVEQHKEGIKNQLDELLQVVALQNRDMFWTPWYNQHKTSSMPMEWCHVYLSVTDRPGVTTSDGVQCQYRLGETPTLFTLYTEDFLTELVNEIDGNYIHIERPTPVESDSPAKRETPARKRKETQKINRKPAKKKSR